MKPSASGQIGTLSSVVPISHPIAQSSATDLDEVQPHLPSIEIPADRPDNTTNSSSFYITDARAIRPPTCKHLVKRRPIGNQECRICLGDLKDSANNPATMLWCKNGCGHNFHESCFYKYEREGAASCGHIHPVKCILCRKPWNWTTCRCDKSVSTKDDSGTVIESVQNHTDDSVARNDMETAPTGPAASEQQPDQAGHTAWGCA